MTPVVLIPALLCDDALYGDALAALGGGVEPHVLLSPKPVMGDSVADILDRAPPLFVLVGTSYGGNLALEVALAAPERVSALWLMGCDPGGPAAGGPDLAAGLEATPDAVIGMLAGLVVHGNHAAAASVFQAMAGRVGGAAGAAQARALRGREAVTPRLGGLRMPTLVVWGEDDTLVPVATGRALADALPHGRFNALPHCGHLPTLEQPEACAALFGDFLSEEKL